MTKINVITREATTTPLSPRKAIAIDVANDVPTTFTRLLPIRSDEISRSFRSKSFSTVVAFLSPRFASARIRASDAAVNAVSDPEKKEDARSNRTMTTMRMIIPISIILGAPSHHGQSQHQQIYPPWHHQCHEER